MSEYFSKPKSFGASVKVELDSPDYATKSDFKNVAGVDTSDFAKKADSANLKSDTDKLGIDKLKHLASNLSNFKSKVDEIDIGKLKTTPVDLSKLGNVVKNDVVNPYLSTVTYGSKKVRLLKHRLEKKLTQAPSYN